MNGAQKAAQSPGARVVAVASTERAAHLAQHTPRQGRQSPPSSGLLSLERARWALASLVLALAAVFTSCVLTSCGGSGGNTGNLLLRAKPSLVEKVYCTSCLTDGAASVPGDAWDTNLSARFAEEDSFVVYDLGKPTHIGALWLEGDHNDVYRVLTSDDGIVFDQVWDAPPQAGTGMRDRFVSDLDLTARYLRLEAARGDGRFGVAEFQAFERTPEAFPPEVPRRKGLALEIGARTKILTFALAAGVCLLLTYQGAPLLWTLLLALLPLFAAGTAISSILQALPVEQRQVSLVRGVVALVAAAAILREVFAPKRWPAQRAVVLSTLFFSGVVGVLAFYNLGRPQFWDHEHNEPTVVHVLDLRQYYQTAKYFDELGYRDMYLADMAAYIEDVPGATLDNMRNTPMRDLYTHRMSTVGDQRSKIEVIKQRFTPERWQQYKKDAQYFRDLMGRSEYLQYMFDFGSNATPVWMSILYYMFSTFDANMGAFLLTALLDPLLFLVAFAAIWHAFGFRTMCVVMVVFGANDFIMYGSNWGGAVLRHDWLVYLALGACALRRKWYALGGLFLALSTSIRAFPVVALVGVTFPALWWVIDHVRAERRLPSLKALRAAQGPVLRVLGSAALTGVVLFALTSLRWSVPIWTDWLWKVGKLSADAHGNSIALRALIAGWEPGHAEILRSRWMLYAFSMAAYIGAVFLACRRKTLEQAAMFGVSLVPVVFYPAIYYIHIVMLLPLVVLERKEPLFRKAATPVQSPLAASDAWVWVTLLGLCAAQYWTVLVTDLGLHFYFATVLLFAAYTVMLTLILRADLRAGFGAQAQTSEPSLAAAGETPARSVAA